MNHETNNPALTADQRARMRWARMGLKVARVKQSGDTGKAPIVDMIGSTAAVDRDGDIIHQDGWVLDFYRLNAVVPWAHDYKQPPVAKDTNPRVEDGQLRHTWEFTPRDLYPFGFMVGRMYELGFLSASSAGFLPLEAEPRSDADGFHLLRNELMESSAVVVPSNRGALGQARAAGIDTAPLKGWASRTLDEKPSLTDFQRAVLEAVYQDAGPPCPIIKFVGDVEPPCPIVRFTDSQ